MINVFPFAWQSCRCLVFVVAAGFAAVVIVVVVVLYHFTRNRFQSL